MNKKIKTLVAAVAIASAMSGMLYNVTFAGILGKDKEIKISVMSDLHLFPEEFAGDQGPNFQAYLAGDRKMLMESGRILDAAIDKILVEKPDVVLVPGDLTKDSEVISHEMVVERLRKLEDNGVEVFVINGNHDINNPDAVKFVPDVNNPGNDIKVEVDRVKQDGFIEMYDEFGYGQSIAQHEGSVSYVAQLKPGYRLISIDTNTYGDSPSEQKTEGYFREGLVQWVLEQIEEAKKAGDEVIGMMHHGIVEHFDGQATVFAPYVVKGWEEASTLFADAGMKYVFTGHFHAQDIVAKQTESGNYIYDIMTGSLVTAPSPVRTVEINSTLDRIDISSLKIESIEGIPDFQTYANEFLAEGIPDMVISLFQDVLLGMLPSETHTLDEVLDVFGVDSSEENIEIIREMAIENEIEGAEEFRNTRLFSNAEIKNFIIGVTEELRTAVITGDTKFMEVIQYCLIEVYNGDEKLSPEMALVLDEIRKPEVVVDFFATIISKHTSKLGFGMGLILNKQAVINLLNSSISEGETIGGVITDALAGLMSALLTDPMPGDNNVLLYGYGELTANKVIEAINTLPENITLEHKDKVETIRYIFNDLKDSEKGQVSNTAALAKAEATIEKLEADKEAADNVIAIIDELPTEVTLDHKEAVQAARKAYDSLTEEQKVMVSNFEKLEKAEKTLEDLANAKDEESKEENNNGGTTTDKNETNGNSSGSGSTKPSSGKLPNTGVAGAGMTGLAGLVATVAGVFMNKKKKA